METVIKELNARGFRVNNLFQLDETYWRCNLRGIEETFFDFAEGKTPQEALQKALAKTKNPPKKVVEDFSDILG